MRLISYKTIVYQIKKVKPKRILKINLHRLKDIKI